MGNHGVKKVRIMSGKPLLNATQNIFIIKNMLVFDLLVSQKQDTLLREHPKVLTTTFDRKLLEGPRLITVLNGNKVSDVSSFDMSNDDKWTIRRIVSKSFNLWNYSQRLNGHRSSTKIYDTVYSLEKSRVKKDGRFGINMYSP